MRSTLDVLVNRYGLLLNYGQLAEVLGRQPQGLRISLSRPRDEWARRVNSAKVRFGRRVMFRSADIAQLIDERSESTLSS
jgi:hypothetical protein